MKKVFLVEDNKDNADLVLDMINGIYEVKIFPTTSNCLII
jgi:hypothetical protein